jgi:hypothetical protein
MSVSTFTGTGSTTTFALSVTPTGINQTMVNIDGVSQLRAGYSLSGSNIVFSEAPVTGAAIEVTTVVYGTNSFVTRDYTGDGTTVNYTVTSGATANSVIVALNGVVQRPSTDYTITGAVLTFTTAPINAINIQIREIPAGINGSNGYTGSAGVGYTGSAGASASVGDILSPFLLMGA